MTDKTFKRCTKCGKIKPISDFYRDRSTSDGRKFRCKECQRADVGAWKEAIKDEIKQYNAKWYSENKDYYIEYRRKNPEKMREASRKWAESHPEKLAEQRRNRRKNPKFKVENAIRCGVYDSIKHGSKRGRKTFDLLGYKSEELMAHLESLFQSGMSWDNYGKWHIDHKIPLAAHNYETPDDIDFKRAWSLSNLQPLWAEDNIRKHSKLNESFQPSLSLAANDNSKISDDNAA